MSGVVSFRLDKNNPREAQALNILNSWIDQRFSVRFILTKALLELDHSDSGLKVCKDSHHLDCVLDRIDQVIGLLQDKQLIHLTTLKPNMESPSLSESFLASVKRGANAHKNRFQGDVERFLSLIRFENREKIEGLRLDL